MKEFKGADKIVQQMSRDGAVEVNKATGGAENISMREASTEHIPSDEVISVITARVSIERKLSKKKAQRKANQKIFDSYQNKPETTRLKFTDTERKDPAMAEAIRKSDKAADRYEKARVRVPKEKVLAVERVPKKSNTKPKSPQKLKNKSPTQAPMQRRVSDKSQGKTEMRLVFRERDKPPNGKMTHALERPTSEVTNFARNEVRKHENDNTGVQAAGATERTARGALRTAGRVHSRLKFAPQRKLLRANKKATKANVNAIYRRNLRTNSQLKKAGAVQKALFKRRLKRNYAHAFRQGAKGTKATVATIKKVAVIKTIAVKAALFVKLAIKKVILTAKFAKFLLAIGSILFLLIMLVSCLSSCMSMFGGGITNVIATSYTAEDDDIFGANDDYIALQNALAERIANIANEFPDFDEYRFFLDPIEHDPFDLISYLTAVYLMFTQEQVQSTLAFILSQQFTLTLTPVIEIRVRIEYEPDGYGGYIPVEVEYEWHILNVTLVNHGIEAVALANLTADQLELFLALQETQGNRPELFP